jgi:hypothetical protein
MVPTMDAVAGSETKPLGAVVQATVQETLNALLDAKRINCAVLGGTSARRIARIRGRLATSGSCIARLGTAVPKLRSLPFETAIIGRYRRRGPRSRRL